ncbi:MAG TPA: hypothetical protein VEB86_07910 [Chryseosolibacter sp.]|nr:hypothetical protein [Chryseosolibacter sp.]
MARSNVRRGDKGHGADMINKQRAVDEAMNEQRRVKKEADQPGVDTVKRHSADHAREASDKETGRSSSKKV